MSEFYQNYINGEWVDSKGETILENINPADTREVLGKFRCSTIEETRAAIEAAKKALPGWRNTPAPARGKILFKLMDLMTAQVDELAKMLTREEGKTFPDARGEILKTISVVEFMSGEARRIWGYTSPSELPGNFCYTVKEPLGVVGLITPWNFPVCIPIWKILPAILTGNTVVFKPAESTPATAVMVVKLLTEAGVPAGVVNMVLGTGQEVGWELVQNETVKAISFTGSNETGRKVYTEGASRMKKVLCELGGKNPIVILEDADLDLASTATVQGAFGSTGQRCTATSRVVIEDSVADKFLELLKEKTAKLKVGNGLGEGIDMGPSVDEIQYNKVHEYIQIGKDEGAELVMGGGKMTDGDLAHGYYTEPTIFDKVNRNMRIAKEEIFGPVISILRVKNFEEALDVANDVEYGLTSSVYSYHNDKIQRFLQGIETGITHVNSPTMGGEAHMPFGGYKCTGIGGREMGPTAIDFFTQLKTIYIDYTGAKRESKTY